LRFGSIPKPVALVVIAERSQRLINAIIEGRINRGYGNFLSATAASPDERERHNHADAADDQRSRDDPGHQPYARRGWCGEDRRSEADDENPLN
jgi:hypothetical protein